mgnify:CR=1 FL=1
MFFVIHADEDGICISKPLTEEELLKRITPDEDGHTYYDSYKGPPVFLDKIPEIDKGSFYQAPEGALVIIRGEIVVPSPVEVVKQFMIPPQHT